ncbi:MAG: FHA domain-containing protein [Planctomycetes bacterium]|nr:FHA domain-containing protein [Planctomycetota bacterium]
MTEHDRLFLRLALNARFLTQGQIDRVMRELGPTTDPAEPLAVARACSARGLISLPQWQSVLTAFEYTLARREDKLLGHLAVKQGRAAQPNVQLALDEQKRAWEVGRVPIPRLLDMLAAQGQLSAGAAAELLAERAGAKAATPEEDEGREEDTPTLPYQSLSPVDAESVSQTDTTGWLTQETGQDAGRIFPVACRSMIGRQNGFPVPLADAQASREHARIDFDPVTGTHLLADLKSRNGTLLNDSRVDGSRRIVSGDRIRIGDTTLRFLARAGLEPGSAPPPSGPGGQGLQPPGPLGAGETVVRRRAPEPAAPAFPASSPGATYAPDSQSAHPVTPSQTPARPLPTGLVGRMTVFPPPAQRPSSSPVVNPGPSLVPPPTPKTAGAAAADCRPPEPLLAPPRPHARPEVHSPIAALLARVAVERGYLTREGFASLGAGVADASGADLADLLLARALLTPAALTAVLPALVAEFQAALEPAEARRDDSRLAGDAVERGWLLPEDFAEVVQRQAAENAAGRATPLAALLCEGGFLTPRQVLRLLEGPASGPGGSSTAPSTAPSTPKMRR